MRLNKNLDEVRGRILGMKPLPTIREAFSIVQKEESRKNVMMGEVPIAITDQNLALATRGIQHNNDNRSRRGRPWYDHCRKTGHTRDNCWKIHGKLADWKPSKPTSDRKPWQSCFG